MKDILKMSLFHMTSTEIVLREHKINSAIYIQSAYTKLVVVDCNYQKLHGEHHKLIGGLNALSAQ